MESIKTVKKLPTRERRTVSGAREGWVKITPLQPGTDLPLVVEPAVEGVDLFAWAAENRTLIEESLVRHGGILFRGFGLATLDDLHRLVDASSEGGLLQYQDQATPRSQVQGNVYTSTDYPADQPIELHNESCYAWSWPRKIFFQCALPAQQGGETPIADTRRVWQRLSPATQELFLSRQVMYIRNFGDGNGRVGLPWQSVFGTDDPAVMEEWCRRNQISVEWLSGGRLRTRQVRPAVARHPRTGEVTWFNQSTAFHSSTLDPRTREVLVAELGEDGLPKDACFGDGSPIPAEVLDEVRAAVRAETVAFPWRQGDVLLLDNLLVAHGRSPFSGPRKILVGMAEPHTWDEVRVS